MTRRYDTILFDLDGTLLDTIDDLTQSVNHVLGAHGRSPLCADEVKLTTGLGLRTVIEKCLEPGASEDEINRIHREFRAYYDTHYNLLSRPYPGILPLLSDLKKAGCRLGVVSNKSHALTVGLTDSHLCPFIDFSIGAMDGKPKKPDPWPVQQALSALKHTGRCVYVGDTEIDLQTARRSDLDCILVGWGFRPSASLHFSGVPLAETPEALSALLLC